MARKKKTKKRSRLTKRNHRRIHGGGEVCKFC